MSDPAATNSAALKLLWISGPIITLFGGALALVSVIGSIAQHRLLDSSLAWLMFVGFPIAFTGGALWICGAIGRYTLAADARAARDLLE